MEDKRGEEGDDGSRSTDYANHPRRLAGYFGAMRGPDLDDKYRL